MPVELYGLDSLVDCLVDLIGKYSPLSDRPRDVIAIFLVNGTDRFDAYWGPILLFSVRPEALNHVRSLLMIQGDRSSQ